jgi:N-formylglutamate deformylase
VALQSLQASDYKVQHNFLFQGGYLTRHFGNPGENQHALQLEMTKVNYMDDAESTYAPERAARMRRLLRDTLGAVARSMEEIE